MHLKIFCCESLTVEGTGHKSVDEGPAALLPEVSSVPTTLETQGGVLNPDGSRCRTCALTDDQNRGEQVVT